MANYINGITHIVPKKKFKEVFEVIGKIYDLAYDMKFYLEDIFEFLTTHGKLLLPKKRVLTLKNNNRNIKFIFKRSGLCANSKCINKRYGF